MSDPNDSNPPQGFRQKLWQRPRKWYFFGIPLGGLAMFVAGIIAWGGFNWAMELSNSEAFCISCHEMRSFVYEEYKKTIHYNNRTGVRAVCADCHVPKEWIHKFVRKVKATNELFHKIMGTINTREKFEAQRAKLAENVWASMDATNARECRNCHALIYMDMEKQDKSARKKHVVHRDKPADKRKSCIDCHKGIAHTLPEGYAKLDDRGPAPHRVASATTPLPGDALGLQR